MSGPSGPRQIAEFVWAWARWVCPFVVVLLASAGLGVLASLIWNPLTGVMTGLIALPVLGVVAFAVFLLWMVWTD